jgi:glycine betaine transporter
MMFTAGFILAIVAWGILAPEAMSGVLGDLLAVLTRNFGWLYPWVVLGLILFAGFVAFGRYGNMKLGGDDEEPEYSAGSWFAMLFAAGMGIGLVFWGVAEPISHYGTAPPGVVPGTPEAANAAMRYVFFHWGLHPWAVYGVVALAIAFFQYRRGRIPLISSVTDALPWRAVRALAGLFDSLAVVATAFGVAASLGVDALQINSGLHAVFGVAIGTTAQVAIIVVTAAVFIASAVVGVEKGIKQLSNFNMMVAVALALAVFILGPTVAIIDTLTNTLGNYLSDIVRMSLRATPFRVSSWVGTWTIFYWAWWISWSPFVGLFIARVSRGRTIHEFVVGTVLAPTLAAFLWFSIFGGSALYMQIWQHVPLAAAVKADVATALFTMFGAMPFGGAMSVVATLLVLVFFMTSGDSAVLVLGMMSSRGNPDPPSRVKLVWGVLVAGIAVSLLMAGGLQALQTATILFALPFALVILLMVAALWRALREDWREEARRERELRRRMREIARG